MFWLPYPFLRYTFLLMAGIGGYVLTDWFHPALWVLLLLAVAALLGGRTRPERWPAGFAASALLLLTGWIVAYQRVEKNDPSHFQYTPQPVRAYRAVVASAVEEKARSFRTTLLVQAVRTGAGWERRSGRIQAYLDKNLDRKPRYGDELLLLGTPEPVAGPRNPAEFDYRRYLARQSIYHRQYLPAGAVQTVGYRPPWALTALALRLNGYADSVLTQSIGTRREYAVVKAMLLGVRDDLDPDLMRAYAASGAIHVLSISGMHVGIFFVALTTLLAGYRRRLGAVSPWTEAGIILALVWGYAILTGLSTPVLRSALMISFLTVGRAGRRRSSAYNTLALSAFVSLCLDPMALFQVGFQLSYLAVGGITYLQPRLARLLTPGSAGGYWLWQGTTTALAAQLATFPLSVYYFHQFPTYFLLVNPIVLALSAGLLYLGMAFLLLCGWPAAGLLIGRGLGAVAWVLNEAVFFTERLPQAVWGNLSLNQLELIALSVLLISFLSGFHTRQKGYLWLALGCALFLSGSASWTHRAQRTQRVLVVHHLGPQTGISLVAGRHLTLLGDSAVRADPRQAGFQLANFWAVSGIRTQATTRTLPRYAGPFGELLSWQGTLILWLHRPVRYLPFAHAPQPVDLLVVSHNAYRYPENVLDHLSVRQLVLDASNSRWTADRWREAARQRGIPCHDVRQAGAFVRRW